MNKIAVVELVPDVYFGMVLAPIFVFFVGRATQGRWDVLQGTSVQFFALKIEGVTCLHMC